MKIQINILAWLAHWWFPDVKYSRLAIEQLCLKVELWSIDKGDLWVINHLKEIQLLYTRSLCGDPIYRSDRIIGIRKDGLPKGLTILNHIFLNGSNQDIRFTLTLLSIYRTIKAWKDPSTSTITSKYTGLEFNNSDFDPFINQFMIDFKIKVFDVQWTKEDYFYSIKAGPNGKATWMSVIDAINLPEHIIGNINTLSETLAIQIRHWRTFSIKIFDKLRFKDTDIVKTYVRKLSVVKDPGGKSRVIAIFDYFTQNILKIIHSEVFKILETIPQDRTFTQDPHVDFDGPYYSFDLSAATDRFPLALQERVVRSLLGSSEKSKAWSEALVSQEFYVPWENKFVKYEVGQPMGAYSSWAIFALSHHIIVQYSASLVGEYPTKNYILLGDDIVIGGSALAEAYKGVIGALGVGISEHKTHKSNETYEFAKRWFRNGVEVSGLQVNAFMETWKHYPLLFQTINTYYERGLFPKLSTSYPDLIESLLVILGTFERKAQNISRKVEILHGFYRWIHHDDLSAVRKVLVNLTSDEASIPNEEHPMFKHLMFIRMDMAYQVIHKNLVSKVTKYMDRVDHVISDDGKTFNPDQIDESEINWEMLDDPNYIEPKSESFSYSDIYHLPAYKSLLNIRYKLMKDERLSPQGNSLKDQIDALVIPDLDNIRSNIRGANVLFKTNILAQKVFHFHKILAKGAWMFEVQGFLKLGLNPNDLPK